MAGVFNSSLLLQISCWFFCLLLIVVFFSQKRLNSKENKIFVCLMLSNFVGLILDVLCVFTMINMDKIPLINTIVTKTYLLYYFTWIMLFTYYILCISKIVKNDNLVNKIFAFLSVIITFLIYYLPQEYKFSESGMNTAGMAVNLVYIIVSICLFICFSCMIIRFIKEHRKSVVGKYLPLIIFMIIGSAAMIIQKINPTLILIPAVESFITFVMYFTIENPDLQVIDELQKNRSLVENSMEDKSVFLFKMTQELKQPIKNINDSIKNYRLNDLSKEDIESTVNDIDKNVKDLTFIMNDVLNVSDIDLSKIKVVHTSYKPKNLFDSIKLLVESKIEKDGIRFNYNISSSIPETLFGDYIKIKQALVAILNNSVDATEEGSIDFEIDSIVKYDVARLIITIRDTGCGMSLVKVNELLSNHDALTEEDLKKLTDLDVDMKLAIRIIQMMNGAINIKSTEKYGTSIVITLDQMVKIEEKETKKSIASYISGKRVLVVDDDSKEIKKIVRNLSKNDLDVSFVMYGSECIDKVRSGEKYDLIIMDDEMMPDNALPTFQKLKSLRKKFTTPVVVMLNEDKEFIKKHYIDDGFSDYLLKREIDKELKRIMEKYL